MQFDGLARRTRQGNGLRQLLHTCCRQFLAIGIAGRDGHSRGSTLLGVALEALQLLVEQACFLELGAQIAAAELESPVQPDGKRAEGDDEQRLKIVAP